MKLYEINEAYHQLMDIDLEPEAMQEALESIKVTLAEKAENVGKVIRTMELEAEAFEAEAKRINELAKKRKNKVESLKGYLDSTMQSMGVKKLEAGTFTLSYRKSSSVVITDESAIPSEYKTEVVTEKVDKNEIKKAIKAGVEIPGAIIEEKQNFQFK